ncbi:MAG: hypothetical protein KDB70_13990 [Mycobacterium sp.]|jgi:hypothetical protein|nr:hypothetical protein [Mycobacterium sp.]
MSNLDKLTARAGWLLLMLFTMLSSYLNARAVQLAGPASTELVIFHAAIPAVLLVAGLYAELVALSGVHRAAKWITVTVLSAIFAVTLIASYIAVLAVVTAWNPHAPTWVNAALAAVPDAAMVMAGTVILSLRMRRHGLAPVASPTSAPKRWSRLADAATDRVAAALSGPATVSAKVSRTPEAEVVEAVTEPVNEPSPTPRRTSPASSPKRSSKPVEDSVLAPFMDRARELAEARVIRGKTTVDYARILRAADEGWSPTRIRRELGVSHTTTAKVLEAAGEQRTPTLAAV